MKCKQKAGGKKAERRKYSWQRKQLRRFGILWVIWTKKCLIEIMEGDELEMISKIFTLLKNYMVL